MAVLAKDRVLLVDASVSKSRRQRAPINVIVRKLTDVLGAQLVAYIGSLDDARVVRRWMSPRPAPTLTKDIQDRLRFAYSVAKCLADSDGAETAQAWFQGENPMLGNNSPAELIRTGDLETDGQRIVAAERYFLAN